MEPEHTPNDDHGTSILCRIDDKQVPLYRVMWIGATPHFCGEEDCMREGYYEVRLEQGESVWANLEERDRTIAKLEAWQGGIGPSEDGEAW
ncbi:hypothetical protein Pla175_15420 [Pirellulimonas nuda]|uniref:Uncharacterized protein n=1 Tax=Pirellulimonas nuda TaxID=2528009 RepID=A0A518D9L3_9BACT|nr:hypothetical protein [Pirellulimonas nuda]QDU88171.1 hypothetical protein Pla175_15420 [Pirellulimonas nuda]